MTSQHCPCGTYDPGVETGNGQNEENKTGAECLKDERAKCEAGPLSQGPWRVLGRARALENEGAGMGA